MSTPSIDEATNQLPSLMERALSGESIAIARNGQPVVELRPIPPKRKLPSAQEALAWLNAHRVGDRPARVDPATEVRRMRDEGA